MTTPTGDPTTEAAVEGGEEIHVPRDAENWAKAVSTLSVGDLPPEAINRNVQGRRVMSPLQGFGKMWQKTYKVTVPGDRVSPKQLIATWKEHFPQFWPPKNFFYGPLTGIAPGEVAVLNLSMPGRLKLSTGVLVLYADDESFTLMTPQGHMFAGWITFSAFELDGGTVAQAQVLMRADDPIYEVGLALGGHRKEDKFWEETLGNVASHFGVEDADVDTQSLCVDKKRQWRNAKNIWHNSAIRSGMYAMGAPFRAIAKPFKKKESATAPPE
ncbi:MAG TPA: hypothetical protein VFK89_09960 [Actinomycetota bacterium]|nr:hypothetical protein [Actinomycetota bacterium]